MSEPRRQMYYQKKHPSKNVDEVISLTNRAGLARPVARLRPIAVIKG